MLRNTCCILFVLLLSTFAAYAQNIQIQFTGIRSPKGQIVVKIYENDKSFEDDKPCKTVKFPKQGITNGQMNSAISLPPGTYGFALLDDENGNSRMEYNLVGMPKEGFGFSDFYLTGFKKPQFHQFKFTLAPNRTMNITMKVRYL